MRYQIAQGYVRRFQGVSREMTPEEVAKDINEYIEAHGRVLFGAITLNPDALYQYGTLAGVEADGEKQLWTCTFRHEETNETAQVTYPYASTTITHDIEFPIDDEQRGVVPYRVFYLSFTGDEPVTFYIAAADEVTDPLDCVADFYVRAHKVGTDLTFDKPAACDLKK